MKTTAILFNRNDLQYASISKSFHDIDICDFKYEFSDIINNTDMILFVDDDRSIKFLKDRYYIKPPQKDKSCDNSNKEDSYREKIAIIKSKIDTLLNRGFKIKFMDKNCGHTNELNTIYISEYMSIDYINKTLDQYLNNCYYELKEYVEFKNKKQ